MGAGKRVNVIILHSGTRQAHPAPDLVGLMDQACLTA